MNLIVCDKDGLALCMISSHTCSLVDFTLIIAINHWMHLLEPMLLLAKIFRSDCTQILAVCLLCPSLTLVSRLIYPQRYGPPFPVPHLYWTPVPVIEVVVWQVLELQTDNWKTGGKMRLESALKIYVDLIYTSSTVQVITYEGGYVWLVIKERESLKF